MLGELYRWLNTGNMGLEFYTRDVLCKQAGMEENSGGCNQAVVSHIRAKRTLCSATEAALAPPREPRQGPIAKNSQSSNPGSEEIFGGGNFLA